MSSLGAIELNSFNQTGRYSVIGSRIAAFGSTSSQFGREYWDLASSIMEKVSESLGILGMQGRLFTKIIASSLWHHLRYFSTLSNGITFLKTTPDCRAVLALEAVQLYLI